jgi:TPR repeat protein
MEKAVSLGDPEAMVMLGYYYVYEITLEGGQPDYKRARNLFQKAAQMQYVITKLKQIRSRMLQCQN